MNFFTAPIPVTPPRCRAQSPSYRRRSIPSALPVLLWLLLVVAGIAGCFSPGAKDRKAAPARGVKRGSGVRTDVTLASVHPRLGLIEQVPPGASFVLIDIGTAPAPPAGTRLQAFSGTEPNAYLIVSTHQKRPFLIADIVSGTPQNGDSVSLILECTNSTPDQSSVRENSVP